ncbi:hypothetical protein Clacol_008177 [Clathrus columnatus]|uniref:Uncharacterized protein n=1 Tax=Clathrus columnatus TaxID=1419009 RepID=A0AAV5AHS1_9AGAM|nr:hypothetical protein Clacol_008177 [Clathrus columnatus]
MSKNTLLQQYTAQLNANPLRTKAVTAATLSFVQEVLASHLAGVPVSVSKSADPVTKTLAQAKITSRAVKMAAYGFLVSAPLSHVLISWMSSPLATLFAQKYLAPELWVPFFNLVQFCLGTYFNTKVKKMRMLAEEKKKGRGE